jgi:predicted lipoprotein with Yx(FWY)xxD motif
MSKAYSVVAVLAVVIGAFVVGGCGGSDGGGDPAVVSVGNLPEVGPALVTGKGITIYAFAGDKGTKSECYEACEKACPPLLTDGDPVAEGGAIAAKLGTTERKNGTTQVTYEGRPLYTWLDEEPGARRGWGVKSFGFKWYPIKTDGKIVPNPLTA